MQILSLNPGSSSFKFGLFGVNAGEAPVVVIRENLKLEHGGLREAVDKGISKVCTGNTVDAIACRVVHGGLDFAKPTKIDPNVISKIEALSRLAPLHNGQDLIAIKTAHEHLAAVPVYAVFDTAFHRTMPKVASTYGLPLGMANEHGLQKYGFHGIAYSHTASCLPGVSRLVACHLGNGASACAILDGRSVDTTMGLTPLEGLVMGTRSGDLDPSVVIYLVRELGMSAQAIEDLLNHRSGLLGLSESTGDVQKLEALAGGGDAKAKLALDVFVYRVAKAVGALAAGMGGLDGLAFSGGIGEGSSLVRQGICNRLGFIGVELESGLNDSKSDQELYQIAKPGSIPIWIVQSDEELQMAREVADSVNGNI